MSPLWLDYLKIAQLLNSGGKKKLVLGERQVVISEPWYIGDVRFIKRVPLAPNLGRR